ncbi:hypothetical protein [Christiangramia sediminis]|uniref:Vitellogenin II n=1 Tax=Christiangramia sediminis TaxID=2881336 RepID=A0A9X1LIS9_9FLAO|nr:hypothetical protein [Christiangramia sediminis]MCB7481133.1 hypothetical protein [Christiangramia sediminis]
MKLYNTLRNKLGLLLAPMAVFALASCGSYQYSGYESDGIYGESRPGIWEQQEPEVTEVRPNNENSYYKNLFAQQSQMVGEVLESDVFTDVDSYSSNDGYENYSEVGGDVAYVGGNAPWGQDPDTYTINVYNNGFYGGFYSPWRFGYGYGFGNPYFGGWYDPFWDPFFPNWGPWGPRWGTGWVYGGGFGYGFGFGGFHNPYYPYYNNYNYNYNNNRYAYSTGRRNSRATYTEGERRRDSYSQRIRDIRSSRASEYGTSRVRSSTGNNDSRVYTRTSRRSEPTRSYDYNRSRSSSPSYERSSRSSNNTYRSSPSRRSSSSSRSSTVRSSSSSSRSSGTTTRSSGGSSRGGRGGGR